MLPNVKLHYTQENIIPDATPYVKSSSPSQRRLYQLYPNHVDDQHRDCSSTFLYGVRDGHYGYMSFRMDTHITSSEDSRCDSLGLSHLYNCFASGEDRPEARNHECFACIEYRVQSVECELWFLEHSKVVLMGG